ncbi:AMP-binding protein [Rhodococcus hoagii]|nr:AMP-binding protein [Prescottella equi]
MAVAAGDRTVTYRQLVVRAESLARELVARGAGPGVRVACAVPRSLDSVTAVWAIARTGAAPVMIDPEHPAARIQLMLEACGVRTGVTTAEGVVSLPSRVEWFDVAASGTGVLGEPAITRTTRPTWCSPRARPATPKRSSSPRAASARSVTTSPRSSLRTPIRGFCTSQDPGSTWRCSRCCWRVCRAPDSWWLPDRPTAGRNSPS